MNKNRLQQLVRNFHNNLREYKNSKKPYNEHLTRSNYIDPFFELLGWDVSGKKGVKPHLQEVMMEISETDSVRPDYTFTLSGVKKFFVEAKKPYVNLLVDSDPAYQARSYGWSARHSIVVLTNFEYLLIYDATVEPNQEDSTNTALLKKYHYSEYKEKWNEINEYLSRETVYSGRFNDIYSNLFDKKDRQSIDQYFLKQVNDWRTSIATDIYKKHPEFSIGRINDLAQLFINQMIFLRMCEDRNLPLYHRLYDTLQDSSKLHQELIKTIYKADQIYNSGIFEEYDFIEELSSDIIIDMIESLYFPKSPYKFSVIDASLLGEIYELFLRDTLIIKGNKLVLAEKLKRKKEANKKDIISTPVEIVKYMVTKSLNPICNNKSPIDLFDLKVADIACGSGIFLIGTFDYLLSQMLEWYIENERESLIEIGKNRYKLPFEIKKQLLLNCIYGIDIDANAVEVAKFSLLIKLLEDETAPTLQGMDKVLPALDENIKEGNSLINFDQIDGLNLTDKQRRDILPFNWHFNGDYLSFDVIIGNPPYVKTEDLKKNVQQKEFKIFKESYETTYKQFDKYYLFIEKAIEKLRKGGTLCFIVPNKFSKIESGEKLRKYIVSAASLEEFIDFGSTQLFKGKDVTVYSSILLIKKEEQQDTFVFEEVEDINEWWANNTRNTNALKRKEFSSNIIKKNAEEPWILVADKNKLKLLETLYENSLLLGQDKVADVFNGIQTSAERPVPVYWFDKDQIIRETDDLFNIKKGDNTYWIEKSILKPFFKPINKSEQNIDTYETIQSRKWIIFPYDDEGKVYSSNTMEEHFPNTYKYLYEFYDRLLPKKFKSSGSGRDVPHASKETWYHYGRIQALNRFIDTPKIIVGILTNYLNPVNLLDYENMLIASGGTAGYCAITELEGSPYQLEFVQAVLNHPAINWLCSVMGSDFRGGFYSRGTYILERIPVKNVDFNDPVEEKLYNDVVVWTKRIYEINKSLTPDLDKRKKRAYIDEKKHLINSIQNNITTLYGVEDLMKYIN